MPTLGGSPGSSYYGLFTTINPTTGAAVNADSLPTVIPYKNGVNDAATFTLTVANVSTGLYKITGTIPAGYVGGDSVSVVISATVSAIAGVKVVDEFLIAPTNYYTVVIDGSGRVDVGKIAGQTASAAGAVTFPGTIASTTNITAGTITTTTNLTNAPTAGDFTAVMKTSIGTAVASAAPTAAQIATAVWTDTTSGDFTVSSSIGKSLFTSGVVPGAAGGLFIAGTNAATTITTSLTTHIVGTVDTVTTLTNLPSIPNNWLTAAGIAASALNGKGNWLTSASLPTNFGSLAITAAGGVTLADGVVHGGTTAMLQLGSSTTTAAFLITNSGGDAFRAESTGGNGKGMRLVGIGSGDGLYTEGGTNGAGVLGIGLAGMKLLGANTGNKGLHLIGGGGNGPGINAGGSAFFIDGSSDFTHGIFIQGGGTAGSPIAIEALGGGPGIDLVTDLAGDDGMRIRPTSGHGINVLATGSGKKALLLAGDAATDSLAIAAGTGSPIDIFDAAGRVLGRFDATGLAEFFTVNSGTTYSSAVSGSVVKEIVSNASGGGSAPSAATVAAAVWDEVLTAATHNIANSAGKLLRLINPTSNVIRSGTLPSQAGMTSTQVKLDAGASSVDGVYVNDVISITTGSPAGESAIILGYEGSSRIATLDRAWVIQPAATNQFEITPLTTVAVAGTVTVGGLTAAALAQFFSIDTGTIYAASVSGSVVREIGSLVTSSPGPTPATIATAVWQDLLDGGDFDTAGSIGAWLLTYSAPHATVASATSTTVTLPALAADSQAIPNDGRYVNAILRVVTGTGRGQVVVLTDPTGTSRQYGVRPGTMPVTLDSTSGIQFAGTTASSVHSLTPAALAEFFTVDTTRIFGDAIGGSVVKEIATGTGSDPWAVHLPGSYVAGTAGYIIGNRLDVSVSSRSTYAGTDTPGVATLLSRISSAITINGGGVAIDWAHVLNPTTAVNLSATTISPSQVVASVTGNVGGTINGFTVSALAQFFTTNTTKVYADAVSGSVVKEISTNSSGGGTSTLTASDVWSYATRTLTSLGATAPVGWINAASIVDHALDGKGDWSTYDGGDTPGVTTLLSRIGGTITITGGGVKVNLAQTLTAARLLTSVGDTSLTLNDAMHCAVSSQAGQETFPLNSTTYTTKTPTGTALRAFTTDSASNPRNRT